MRYINLDTIKKEEDFKSWRKKVKKNYRELCKAPLTGKSDYIDGNEEWRQLKPILKRVYGKKCWYSDCGIEGEFGDVDHFRPKKKSIDENEKTILPGGYWWLAYDFKNYRLSCEVCNRKYGDGGKCDFFPLQKGSGACDYPNRDDKPILLDPCVLDDVNLIDADETGNIIALSSDPIDKYRVSFSTKIYNWHLFNDGRKQIRNDCSIALEQFDAIFNADVLDKNCLEISLRQILNLLDEKRPYSSFANKYFKAVVTGGEYEDIFEDILWYQ